MPTPAFATVDDYIDAQSAEAQPRLRELRTVVRAAVPEAVEGISYGMPTYKLPLGAVAYFGAARKHCALYGNATDALAEELRGYDAEKGTVRFSLDRPIPAELVRKLVLANVAARNEKKRQKGTKSATSPGSTRSRSSP